MANIPSEISTKKAQEIAGAWGLQYFAGRPSKEKWEDLVGMVAEALDAAEVRGSNRSRKPERPRHVWPFVIVAAGRFCVKACSLMDQETTWLEGIQVPKELEGKEGTVSFSYGEAPLDWEAETP